MFWLRVVELDSAARTFRLTCNITIVPKLQELVLLNKPPDFRFPCCIFNLKLPKFLRAHMYCQSMHTNSRFAYATSNIGMQLKSAVPFDFCPVCRPVNLTLYCAFYSRLLHMLFLCVSCVQERFFFADGSWK